MTDTESDCHIIKLRGLPWNVSVKDILEFLKDAEILRGEDGIHLITSPRDGRPNGEAFVELASENDYNKAFDYHKKTMGHRYIEIFGAKKDEFEFIMKKQNVVQPNSVVKLRGLPYTVTRDDIETFFEGLELRSDKDSVHIMMDNRGRATGEAFVQFVSPADTEKALKLNREKIGHRYIEIFRSTSAEVRRNTYNLNRPGPYSRNDRGGNGGTRGRSLSGGGGGGNMRGGWDNGGDNWGSFDNRDNFNDFGGGNNNFGNGGGGGGGINNFGNGFGNNGGGNNFGNNGGGNGFGNFGNNFGNGGGGFNNGGGGGGNGFNNGGGFGGGNNGFSQDDNFGGNNFGGLLNFSGNNSGGGGGFNDRFDDNGFGRDYCVYLRGMPYDCDEKDIIKFFQPLRVADCHITFTGRGRPSGEAEAYFLNEMDANDAMKRNKEKMGNRYIELFLNIKGRNRRKRF